MFENIFESRSSALSSVIAVDPHTETIGFYTKADARGKVRRDLVNYKARPFDQEFFNRLAKAIKSYQEKYPEVDLQKTAIVMPDQLFLTDTVKIPVIHRRAMNHSLSLAVESIYKNAEDLNITTIAVQQNKQYATFGLVGMRKDVLAMLQEACGQNNVGVSGVTFAANAMVNGAFAMNPKLRNGTFLLLDIKESYSRFAFVVRGSTMGYYDLPFGYGMLYKSRLAAEDMLFDHRPGELLVLNAKEKARAKQLTMGESVQNVVQDSEDGSETLDTAPTVTVYESSADGSIRKTARRLPKFMQRPTPQSREEYVYENFRIFLKWSLDLIANNNGLDYAGALDTVYVNMPAEYRYLFEMVNQDKEEHKVTFAPLLPEDTDEEIAENLEMFGGFYLHQNNRQNVF